MMHPGTKRRLELLRSDYTIVVGQPFAYFFCPILFRDDDVLLCQGHIVNKAYTGSTKRWTVQRKDVDNLYGSLFESTFVQLRHRGKRRPQDFLLDRDLARHTKPQIMIQGKVVEHYIARDPVPAGFSDVILQGEPKPVHLALKIDPAGLLAAKDEIWEINVAADLRLSAVGSLLKAAHLTLFEMLGYRYAFSPGGHFLGHDILGHFFLSNVGRPKSDALTSAMSHFREFVNMVRPLQPGTCKLKGTATDRMLYLCRNSANEPWALLVFIRTGTSLHAVLTPAFDAPDGVDRFLGFLKKAPERFQAHLIKFEDERWLFSKEPTTMTWPRVDGLE